jgi:uncharacterized protein YdhG (YjbR/CyaY superfamily)
MAMSKAAKPQSIDEYIASQEAFMRPKLIQLRKTIWKAAPEAEELISYSMPAYKFHGMLVYFSAFKNHLGFYAMKEVMSQFKDKIELYQSGAATLQFQWDKPLPVKLIAEIVKYRAQVNLDKKMAKETLKKKKK